MSGAPLPYVKLLVVELDLFASENDPRGSVEGLNVSALAADWGLSGDEQLARIYATLEHPEVGWIDQDFIVSFWARNPDQELTEREREQARERQQRKRDRAKEAKGARAEAGYPQSRVTQRDSVTSRSRSDQIIKKAAAEKGEIGQNGEAARAESATAPHSGAGDSGDYEIWLALEGKRIVAERCRLLPTSAWTHISRWRRELADDLPALATMIEDADVMGLVGGKFTDRIRDRIIAYRYDAKGNQPSLPLKTIIKRSGNG